MTNRFLMLGTSGSVIGGLFYLSHLANSAMRESPTDAFAHQVQLGETKRITGNLITAEMKANYRLHGVMVLDNVLSPSELKAARQEVNTMLLKKRFAKNGNEDIDVRTDIVFQISEIFRKEQKQVIGDALLLALRCVRAIPSELGDLGIENSNLGVPYVNQLACYDGKLSHYIPHRDAPEIMEGQTRHPFTWLTPGMDEPFDRQITIILYLNEPTWDSNSGGLTESGHLKCYLHTEPFDMVGTSATETLSIQPIGGRMVIFNSKTILHEVCPSDQRRSAITCWVGGEHSTNHWVRPMCIPVDELNWPVIRKRLTQSWW